jgi:Na+/proline symporter
LHLRLDDGALDRDLTLDASAISGPTAGVCGPPHVVTCGARMILFISPLRARSRSLGPTAHRLAEILHRHNARTSRRIRARPTLFGGLLRLICNFIAGGALIAMLPPPRIWAGNLLLARGVLLQTLWSGIRAFILTDFGQGCAMLGAAEGPEI